MTPSLRVLASSACLALYPSLESTAFDGRRSMPTHMAIQAAPRLEVELRELPSLRIDAIQASVPVNDRMNADDAFDRPFVDALEEGMSWYLEQRGLRVVDEGEDLRMVGNIDSYEGWRGWGRWGAEMKLSFKVFRGPEVVWVESLHSFLRYADDEDVMDQERPKYEGHRPFATFTEILFTRMGVDLSEKLITALKQRAAVGFSPVRDPSMGALPPASVARGTIAVDASAPHAEVLIDGALVGTTPLVDLVLRAGAHTIEVRKRGFQVWKRAFHVLEDAASTFFAELEPEERK